MKPDKDYDRQIADFRQKIEELERLKTMHGRKLEGVQKFQDLIAEVTRDYSLTEGELFVTRAEAIVAWIKAAGRDGEQAPLFWQQLRDYFAGVNEKARKAPKQKRGGKESALGEPTLPTGIYRNPLNGEKVEKKRRNPKQLDQWLEEFGFTEVRSWLKK